MTNRKKRSSKGFTIAEVLVSLVIIALLMTAVSTAINASIINYTVNKDTFKAMNAARQTLLRITTELRSVNEVYEEGPPSQLGLGFDDDLDAERESERRHAYHYNKPGYFEYDNTLEDNALYLLIYNGATRTPYLLCENVTDMTFTRTPANALPKEVKNVTISMTVKVGDVEKTVSTAAVIRRNMD